MWKFQKKRNLVHKFEREYEGRYEYRTLRCEDRPQIMQFLKKWFSDRMQQETDSEKTLEYEYRGIEEILQKKLGEHTNKADFKDFKAIFKNAVFTNRMKHLFVMLSY